MDAYSHPYMRFYEAHKAFFDGLNPNADNELWRARYAHTAKGLWADYAATDRADIKERYKVGADQSDIRHEPPRAENNWEGADAPLPVPLPAPGTARGAAERTFLDDLEQVQTDSNVSGSNSKEESESVHSHHSSNRNRPSFSPLSDVPAAGSSQIRCDFPHDPGEAAHEISPPRWNLFPPARRYDIHGVIDRDQGQAYSQFIRDGTFVYDNISGTGLTWRRDTKLGEGAYGAVFRWNLIDTNGNVVDRLVAKDVHMVHTWDRLPGWSSDLRDTPSEVAAHRTLASENPSEGRGDDEGRRFIVGYRGFHLNKYLKYYRIASDEARMGDLFSLAESFFPCDREFFRQAKNGVHDFEHEDYERLPIGFIWRMFAALVQACIHMHDLGIVHRDLKLENVLIDAVDDDDDVIMGDWGIKPMLCDFGAAMPTNPIRYENATDFDIVQTIPYSAPEQLQTFPPLIPDPTDLTRPYPLNEKTDIYGIGMVMFAMLQCGKLWDDENKRAVPIYDYLASSVSRADGMIKPDYEIVRDFITTTGENTDPMMTKYWMDNHQDLMDIITHCLRFNPDDRPALSELAEEIRNKIAGYNGRESGSQDVSDQPEREDKSEISRRKRSRWFGHLECKEDI